MKELRAVPKPQRIKSRPLTDSARGRACAARWMCGGSTATTVFCHVRINSGVATKPPDFFGYFGCHDCHAAEGTASPRDVLRAVLETQTLMAEEGLLTVKGWTPR